MLVKYDLKAIAKELQATAQGYAYHGNALYVAMDAPDVLASERRLLERWLRGTETLSDRFELQDLANKLSVI